MKPFFIFLTSLFVMMVSCFSAGAETVVAAKSSDTLTVWIIVGCSLVTLAIFSTVILLAIKNKKK